MSTNKNLQIIIEQVASGDQDANGDLFKLLGKDHQVTQECYQKIESHCVRAYQVDPGRVEDAFMQVWENLSKAIQQGNSFGYQESQLCSYLMQACKRHLLKELTKSRLDYDHLPLAHQIEADAVSISLGEAIDDALIEMGESCSPTLRTYFRTAYNKKLEKQIPLACILRFFGFVRQSASGEALLQFEIILEESVHQLDSSCKYLLQQFYTKSQSLQHLAKKFGVSYGSAKNKRKNCMEKCQRLALRSLKKHYSSLS